MPIPLCLESSAVSGVGYRPGGTLRGGIVCGFYRWRLGDAATYLGEFGKSQDRTRDLLESAKNGEIDVVVEFKVRVASATVR